MSPGSHPISLWLTLPDLIAQSGVTVVEVPSSPPRGHGGGHEAGSCVNNGPMAEGSLGDTCGVSHILVFDMEVSDVGPSDGLDFGGLCDI